MADLFSSLLDTGVHTADALGQIYNVANTAAQNNGTSVPQLAGQAFQAAQQQQLGGGGTQTSSGGGGGSNTNYRDPNANPGNGYFWDAADGWKSMIPQGPSEAELNAAYQPQQDYLNQAEGQLRSDLPSYLQDVQGQYDTNKSLLGNKQTQGLQGVDTTQNQVEQRNTDAISASRRLYQELGMANMQRFGGASSAGQAAGELQGRELQQNLGQQARGFQSTMAQVNQQRTNIQNDYNTGLLQLEQQKQQSVNEINRDFQAKLLQINQDRSQLASAKASARLQALQDMRNQVFQVNVQNQQFQQRLALQAQAMHSSLNNYSQSVAGYGQTAGDAFNGFAGQANTSPMTSFGVGAAQTPQGFNAQQYTGAVSPVSTRNPNDQWDQYNA